MKTLILKSSLFLAMALFLSTPMFANSEEDSPATTKANVRIHVDVDNGQCCVALAECCDFMTDYDTKRSNALKTLKEGYSIRLEPKTVGDFVFHDFVKFEGDVGHVARLVTNQKTKVLMLVTTGIRE